MPASLAVARLKTDALETWPGMTIWGLGDAAHASTVSGHNEDDSPTVRAELRDADNLREYRALDFYVDGERFTHANARALVEALKRDARVYYIIYARKIYRRSTGFREEDYDGSNPHDTHVHVSTLATTDANNNPWTTVLALGDTVDVREVHAFLRSILAADEATERQVRDMIRGGQHAPGGSILGPTNERISGVDTRLTDVDTRLGLVEEALGALVSGVAELARVIAESGGTGGVEPHTHVPGPVDTAPDS